MRLSVLGAGRVGRTLARLWREAGRFEIADVVATTDHHARDAVAFIGGGRPVGRLDGLQPADLYMLTVPDDRIAALAASLSAAGPLPVGATVFHCSGALDSSLLAPLADRGMHCASLHPMHSFADPAVSLTAFAGSCCALEGDEAACALIAPAAVAIGARLIRLDASAKPLYHAAGVVASNYLTGLIDGATELLAAAGVPGEMHATILEPLVRGSVDNLFEQGAEAALTGPISRGDAGVVARQMDRITRQAPQLAPLYREMGRVTLRLAERGGRLTPEAARAVARALDAEA